MIKKIFILIALITPCLSLAGNPPNFFPTIPGVDIEKSLMLQRADVFSTISTIIFYCLTFLGILSIILTIYAGFTWMIARGNEQEIEKAKEILKGGFIGLVIILSAYTISYFVFTTLATIIETNEFKEAYLINSKFLT